MFDSVGIAGYNKIACKDYLSLADRSLLEGFVLSAQELKDKLQAKVITNTTTKTGKARKPRKGKSTPNTYVTWFREISSYKNMQSPVEDLFAGAVSQHATNSNINQFVVFALMKSLPEISTESVYARVNQRRVASEFLGQRYAQELASACRNVIKVFDHHVHVLTKYNKGLEIEEGLPDSNFDIHADAEGYKNYIQPVQGSEQQRNLLQSLGLSAIEIECYMSGRPIGHRAHLRISNGSSVGSSYSVRKIINNHNNKADKNSLVWLSGSCCYVNPETGEMVDWGMDSQSQI